MAASVTMESRLKRALITSGGYMKKSFLLTVLVTTTLLSAACSKVQKYHDTPLPDPKAFNAHFGDMDTDGNDLVNWGEFTAYFQNAEQKVFNAIDMNQDGNIDHDEWHQFKEAHGLKQHD